MIASKVVDLGTLEKFYRLDQSSTTKVPTKKKPKTKAGARRQGTTGTQNKSGKGEKKTDRPKKQTTFVFRRSASRGVLFHGFSSSPVPAALLQ